MNKKVLIFDLDGTLYQLQGGSYEKSILKTKIQNNAKKFISKRLGVNMTDSSKILTRIENEYGEKISIGLEIEFNLNRYDYFNFVWDISTHNIVKKNTNLKKILLTLNKKYIFVLLSDAPKIWIENVLKKLNIYDSFSKNIFSGESEFRKGFNNGFTNVLNKMNLKSIDCISIGDQEKTDIIPAKKLGIKTIYINQTKKSKVADISIKSINDILDVLE